MPWLGRWTACDPIGIKRNTNIYTYVSNKPISFVDSDGRDETPVNDNDTVGKPGFGESLIPVWGSGRDAVYNFQKGNWGWGLAYTALAVTDVFLVKAIVVGAGKLIAKGGAKLVAKEVAPVVAKEAAPVVAKEAAPAIAKEAAPVVDLMGGARSQIPGAINVDKAATSGIRADVMKKIPLATGAADEVIVTNPFLKGLPPGSNAANTWLPEATRILAPGGRMTVTGELLANKFARMPTAEELSKLGLKVVQSPQAVNDTRILAQKMFRTDGTPIKIGNLKSYILEKIK